MTSSKSLLVLGALAAASSGAFAQTVFYRETFSTAAAANNSQPGLAGWAVHYDTARYYSNFAQNAAGLSGQNGRVQDVGNFNAGPTTNTTLSNVSGNPAVNPTGQTVTGLFFASVGGVGNSLGPNVANPATLIWTNEAGSVAASNLQDISFYLGNSTTQPVRIAVQVGAQWYVTNTTFSSAAVSAASNFASTAVGTNSAELKSFSFSTTASSWRTLTFQQAGTNPLTSAGTGNLSLGALATSNLDGNVNAFGLYVDSGNTGIVRFDTFTITAIPEPSSFAALAGLGMLGFAAARRRTRA